MEDRDLFIPGKLLIAGEYVVLDGALAYAVKTRFGQHVSVEAAVGNQLHWVALDHEGRVWQEFSYDLNRKRLSPEPQSNADEYMHRLLHHLEVEKCFKPGQAYEIRTRLTFPQDWGLGSSSTLVAGLARHFNINPYELLAATFGGSGYDVAVGYLNSGLFFELTNNPAAPHTELFNWNPPFAQHLYFVHLNRKQNSRDAMAQYQRNKNTGSCSISEMSDVTRAIVSTNDIDEFAMLIRTHEKILSGVLQQPRIKEERFFDYPGEVKSLGAWGGDFCLAVGNKNTPEYFRTKGFPVCLRFDEMVNTES